MEHTVWLRARLGRAFERYASQDRAMRTMRSAVPERDVTAWIHGVNAQFRLLSEAEGAYRAVRMEYISHLLSGVPRS